MIQGWNLPIKMIKIAGFNSFYSIDLESSPQHLETPNTNQCKRFGRMQVTSLVLVKACEAWEVSKSRALWVSYTSIDPQNINLETADPWCDPLKILPIRWCKRQEDRQSTIVPCHRESSGTAIAGKNVAGKNGSTWSATMQCKMSLVA